MQTLFAILPEHCLLDHGHSGGHLRQRCCKRGWLSWSHDGNIDDDGHPRVLGLQDGHLLNSMEQILHLSVYLQCNSQWLCRFSLKDAIGELLEQTRLVNSEGRDQAHGFWPV